MRSRTSLALMTLMATVHSGRIGIINVERHLDDEASWPGGSVEDVIEDVKTKGRIMNDKERMQNRYEMCVNGKLTREDALSMEQRNARQREAWAEEIRLDKIADAAAQAKRERRRQRNIRIQQKINKPVD